MVRSKATSAHVYTSIEVDFERVERVRRADQAGCEGAGGLLAHVPAVHRARVLRHGARLPGGERERRRRHARRRTTTSTSAIAVDLDFEGLIAPVIRDADGKRLRLIAREVARPRGARPHQAARPDEVLGGTFTITNIGPVRDVADAADHQPAAGRDPVDRRRSRSGRSSSTAPTATTRSPSTTVGHARAHVGPPRVRRRVRGVVPQRDARRARARTTGKPSSSDAAGTSGWLGSAPLRGGRPAAAGAARARDDDYLLLLEHPHVYTLGTTADPAHVLVPPASVGAELVARRPRRRRHLPRPRSARRVPDRHAARVARRPARRRRLRPPARGRAHRRARRASASTRTANHGSRGVWVGDEKIAAIGVKVARGRTRHGFALNVDPDLSMFEHIVPCGIRDRGVTSMAARARRAAPRAARGRRRGGRRSSPTRSRVRRGRAPGRRLAGHPTT